LIFYIFLRFFKVHCKKNKREKSFLQKGPWKNFNQSNWVLDPREKKAGEGVRRILARGSPAARVEWPGKIRSSRRTWWRGRGGLGLAESDSSAASRVAARGGSSGSKLR